MPETGDLGRFFVCLFVCLFGVGGSERGCGFSFTDGSLQLFLRPKYFSLTQKQRGRVRESTRVMTRLHAPLPCAWGT